MKYNYCPICGEELPNHYHGKFCKNCAKKEFRKKAIKTAVITGFVVGAGALGWYYVKHHKKEVAKAATKLASQALALEAKKIALEKGALLDAAKASLKESGKAQLMRIRGKELI